MTVTAGTISKSSALGEHRRSATACSAVPSSLVQADPDTGKLTGRPAHFDHYWEARDLATTDARTRLRLALMESMLTHRNGRLLDVGCGRGLIAGRFAERGFDVTAVDLSPVALEWTRRQHPAIRTAMVDLERGDIEGTYEVIVCLEVLQQVRNPVDVLKRLVSALSSDGELVVSLPNEFHLARRLAILLGRVEFGGIAGTHLKLYTPAEHRRLFGACGLRVTDARTQSIIPPRWWGGRLHHWANRPAGWWPGLLALSVVYRLEPGARG
ncbi:MAG: methyltransferase domain-containing protein [Candidatus Zixiibacteriota bacterium]